MPSDKVSFVVTVYNKARFLPYVLEGLRRQEGDFEREYIFVDDGSTDRGLEQLEAFTDARGVAACVVSQPNGGPSRATNAGLARVTGNYVKIVDGDDVLLPWATASLLAAFEGRRIAYAFSQTSDTYDPDDGPAEALLARTERLRDAADAASLDFWPTPLDRVIRNAQTNPTSWMTTSEVLAQTGGCADHIFIQDYLLELLLADAGPAAHWHGPLCLVPRPYVERASDNEAQILHDMNMSLAEFFRRRPRLRRRYGWRALARASGRNWHFARRHGGEGPLSRAFLFHGAARSGVLPPQPVLFEKACAAFRRYGTIRRPQPRPAGAAVEVLSTPA